MVSQMIQGFLGWGWTSWAEYPRKNLSMVLRGHGPLALLEGGEGGGWRLVEKQTKKISKNKKNKQPKQISDVFFFLLLSEPAVKCINVFR